MANAKTARDAIKLFSERGNNLLIKPYSVDIDTVDTAFEIEAGVAGKHIGIFGISIVNDIAFEITFMSADTDLEVLTLGASSGLMKSVSGKSFFITDKGEALKLKSNAILNKFSIYVATFETLSE